MVIHMNGTEEEDLMAQFFCADDQTCECQCPDGAVLFHHDEHNVTVVLVNVSRSQAGHYKVYVYGTRSEMKIYNITVIGE